MMHDCRLSIGQNLTHGIWLRNLSEAPSRSQLQLRAQNVSSAHFRCFSALPPSQSWYQSSFFCRKSPLQTYQVGHPL